MIKEYELQNGKKRYYFHTYLGIDPISGKKIRTTRRGFKTKREAQTALNKLKYDFDNGKYEVTEKHSYSKVYDQWLEVYKTTVKESTLNRVTQMFRDHILPAFGNIDISKIRSLQCQEFYNNLNKKYKKADEMYNYAKKCYNYAISPLRLVTENPFNFICKKKVKEEEKKGKNYQFLEVEELVNLLDYIKQDSSQKWYTFFHLLGFTGLRKSEALALNWSDIDFNNSTLTVNKTITRGMENKQMIDTAKTINSTRTILLDPDTIQVLKDYKKEQNKSSIVQLKPNQIVFQNDNFDYIQNTKPNKVLDRIIEKNNLKRITVHGFRHSHCCHLFDAGYSIKEVQDRLGQKDLKTTLNIYDHVTEFRKKKSMNKFIDHIQSTSKVHQ